jgi:coenzyme F420-dependent glucose-6-phosphate dehydrogenase
MTREGGVQLGYKASAEQFAPRRLLDFSVEAERIGLDAVAISDHFQPWRHSNGHAPYSLAWLAALGERTERVRLGTSVLTPTFRYHPSIVAQAFGTLACLNPGRVFLGIGAGEAMNEKPALGIEWPKFRERSGRLGEAVELIRQIWSDERVSFEGEYYRTILATIYDRPDEPVPIYIAAGGPKAAKLVGRLGDGFICTSGKGRELYETLLGALAEGAAEAGRDADGIAKMIEIKLAYDHDVDYARESCEWWGALALPSEAKQGIEDPVELERLADEGKDRAHTRFIVSNDPEEVIEQVGEYVELGFSELVFHFPGEDQERALGQFGADVLPLMRERWGGGA